MTITNLANLPVDAIARIERELAGQQNLADMLRWAHSYPAGVFIPTVVANMVVQDEFTHDVIVPFRDGLVLVYDTT